jgi:hypothetical protein
MAVPFLNWLVDIMLESSPSRRLIFAAILRGVNPAQMPRYYRTVSLRVSRVSCGVVAPKGRFFCRKVACDH